MGPAPPPDVQLVREAVGGDHDAAQRLFRALRPIVLAYCRKRLGRENATTTAEDCTQEVLFAVLVARPRYRYRGERFLSWVFGIAAHKTADVHRDRTRSHEHLTPLPDPEAATGPAWRLPAAADDFARVEEHLQVRRVLSRLPRHYRQVLTLRVLLGYSAEETAELLGMPSAEAVRVAQFRAIRRLRRVLRFATA
ncbi:sigma-70 family RNA polymerase sigma factor [Amycolatopsis sp. NPDC049252]|uniref:sigma-70 family RNA polymerase sigma factor n=1 Tax=Amycolatopsis sp. NPDC049252 TaxID=3363933 RepID=UPI003715EFE0